MMPQSSTRSSAWVRAIRLSRIRRGDDKLDQFVDDGILDADRVTARLRIRACRAPEFALLVAWRQRLPESSYGYVEIEFLNPVLILGRHRPSAPCALTPSRSRFWMNGWEIRSNSGSVKQDFEFEGLCRSRHFSVRLSLTSQPAGFSSSCGFAKIGPVVAGPVGRRRVVFRGEDFVRNLAAITLQDLQLLALRQAA